MPTRLEQIKARLESATPGPWHTCLGSGEHLMTAIAADLPDNKTVLIADCLPEYAMDEGWCVEDHRPNMALIAHAPADIAALLRLAEAAERLNQANDNYLAIHSEYPKCNDGNFNDFDEKVYALMETDWGIKHDAAIMVHQDALSDVYAAVRAFREGGEEG